LYQSVRKVNKWKNEKAFERNINVNATISLEVSKKSCHNTLRRELYEEEKNYSSME
jgi:hypothetical protein